jgi:hypothetical protein
MYGTPVPTTKRNTRPATEFDVALRQSDNFMREGMMQDAKDVMDVYATRHDAKMKESDRLFESGMNTFIASNGKDRSGLDQANAFNPIGVDLSMQMDPSGSGRMAVGMNMRGTKAPGQFRGPDGEMSPNPIYMDPREAMILAKGIGSGGTLAALGTIVDLRGKMIDLSAKKQGMAVQLSQNVQSAAQTYLQFADHADKYGGTAPSIEPFMKMLTPPEQEQFKALVASGGAPAQGLPGGTGGTAGPVSAGRSAGFMDRLAQVESDNQNIPSAVDPDVAGPGTKSQGFFQINTPTWQTLPVRRASI